MRINTEIMELVMADLKGDISSEEIHQLKAWLGESEGNVHIYGQIKKMYDQTNEFEVCKTINKQEAWERFRRTINNQNQRRYGWLPYVSAAVGLLVVGLSVAIAFLVYNEPSKNESYASKEIYIRRNGGQVIQIDSIKDQQLVKVGGAEIHKGTGLLEYVADTDDKIVNELNTLVVPKGKVFKLVLADGSEIWVNSDSRLTYPAVFNDEKRRIWLESGEIFIDVSHDSNHPFVVNSMGLDIEVLGTKFNVKAYEGDRNAQVTLKEGSVKISAADTKKLTFSPVLLVPNHQLNVDFLNKKLRLEQVDVDMQTAWLRGEFYFENTSLEEILKTLSRMYDYNVVFRDPQMKQNCYSGRLRRYDNIEDILNALRQFSGLYFEVENQEIIVKKQKNKL